MSGPDPQAASAGDQQALDRYRELRALARRLLAAERPDHTLAPTDLAHEVWLRLAGTTLPDGLPIAEFRTLAARAMRHLLIDHARTRGRDKRPGSRKRISLDALELVSAGDFGELMALDEAIEQLAGKDPALAELVRLRFYAGLTVDETAQALGVSPRSVDRDWSLAKALLQRML